MVERSLKILAHEVANIVHLCRKTHNCCIMVNGLRGLWENGRPFVPRLPCFLFVCFVCVCVCVCVCVFSGD